MGAEGRNRAFALHVVISCARVCAYFMLIPTIFFSLLYLVEMRCKHIITHESDTKIVRPTKWALF